MNKNRLLLLAGMALSVVAARWLPHPPDFTPITALALFGAVEVRDALAHLKIDHTELAVKS
jgi:hypothetical protein